MSKVLGTYRRKRYFFCLREKASGRRELFNCILKEFAKKSKGKDIRKEGLGPLPRRRPSAGARGLLPHLPLVSWVLLPRGTPGTTQIQCS